MRRALFPDNGATAWREATRQARASLPRRLPKGDTLPLDNLTKNSVMMASFVYHAAMIDERIPRKKRE